MPSKKSRLQLYADECFPVTSVTYLKSLGYSIIHAFDRKLIGKSDQTHLKESKKLERVLITLDRDFLYYQSVNLSKHPGVIVISTGSATPNNVNKICKKLLVGLRQDFLKDSLIKTTSSKIIKIKEGKIVNEKIISLLCVELVHNNCQALKTFANQSKVVMDAKLVYNRFYKDPVSELSPEWRAFQAYAWIGNGVAYLKSQISSTRFFIILNKSLSLFL